MKNFFQNDDRTAVVHETTSVVFYPVDIVNRVQNDVTASIGFDIIGNASKIIGKKHRVASGVFFVRVNMNYGYKSGENPIEITVYGIPAVSVKGFSANTWTHADAAIFETMKPIYSGSFEYCMFQKGMDQMKDILAEAFKEIVKSNIRFEWSKKLLLMSPEPEIDEYFKLFGVRHDAFGVGFSKCYEIMQQEKEALLDELCDNSETPCTSGEKLNEIQRRLKRKGML